MREHRFVALLPSPRPCLISLLVDAVGSFCVFRTKPTLFLTYVCVSHASCLVRLDGAESALEVLRMTSERAGNLKDWGRAFELEAKTAEAKALYEDLLPRMERELVR